MSAATLAKTNRWQFFSLIRRWRQGRQLPMQAYQPLPPGRPDATGHVEMALSAMQPGDQGHILSLCTECEARQHLLEMGFTAGTAIEFIRRAPLGDPLTVRIRGYQLSLRRHEANAVWVRVCPPEWVEDGPYEE